MYNPVMNKKLKILFLNHNLKGEGTYFRAFNFARHLAAFGHDMTLITVSQNSNFTARESIIEKVRVIEAPKFLDQHRGGWAPLDILYKIWHVLTNNYDIIHGFDHKPNVFLPLLAAKIFRKNSVLAADWADWWTKGGIAASSRITPEILIETYLEEKVRKIVCHNTVTSVTLMERAKSIGIPEDRITYIPSGCDIERIKPLGSKVNAATRKELGIPQKNIILEFIGFGQGDVDILVDAYNILRKKRGDINLLIVGPLDNKVKEKIESSPYKNGIISTGRVPYSDIPKYASVADICLLPLRDNPANRGRGPIKAGDYMAAGKPIITNNVGDSGVYIKEYKVGLHAGFDGAGFAKSITKMLSSKAFMKKCAANSLKTARTVLSWKKVSEKLNKTYMKIIS